MIRGLKEVATTPVTIKMRIRIQQNEANVTHKYIPFLCDAGVDAITVHGRSKQQRYAKLADWFVFLFHSNLNFLFLFFCSNLILFF